MYGFIEKQVLIRFERDGLLLQGRTGEQAVSDRKNALHLQVGQNILYFSEYFDPPEEKKIMTPFFFSQ